MADAVTTHRLTKCYAGKNVVDALDLRIPAGCVYGLLGRNGAGKSTAIKMLMGLVHPDSGRAELLGEDASALPPATRARIAYLPEGHPLYTGMRIGEAVAFACAFTPRWQGQLVERILDHFELPRGKKIRQLSRGQRAQVALALAIGPDPELLILDDPTIGLDTVVRRDFLESMIQIIQRLGRTILFSSHILSDVERVADRVGVLVDGVLRVDCPTDQFKQSVKRVLLEFDGTPPELPPIAGVLGSRPIGTRLELIVVDTHDGWRQAVDRLQPRSQEIVDLTLEDAFIEYTRGPRRPLPLFSEEPSDGQGAGA